MKRLLLFSWMLLLMACETEITDFKTQNLSSAIVVYGEMSNMAGPYSVRLNYTSGYSPFDVTEFQGQAIQGADVRIMDEAGAAISLKETAKGYYQTPSSFVGLVGKKYQLKIMTKAGQDIASDWQTLSTPVAAEAWIINLNRPKKLKICASIYRALCQIKSRLRIIILSSVRISFSF